MVRGIVRGAGILVVAFGVGCGGDASNVGDVIGDTTQVPDRTCLPGIPCVTDADCPNGHHCNTALNPPVCQKLYCGGFLSACSEDELCLSQQCDGGKCTGGCGTDCGEMVTVSGGAFWQGCNAPVDTECASEEKPYHEVTVPAFEIDKYEVTVGLYGDCVTDGGCSAPPTRHGCNWGRSGREEHPVNCITWYQAGEYCAWAGKRLCSESEWEKASRGMDGRKYPWGNETATCEYCVMSEGSFGCGNDSTWLVASKPAGASPCGAMDMSGNLVEWVEDDWYSDYTGAPTNGNAWVEDPRLSYRVVRGGCYMNSVYADGYLRSSARGYVDPAGDHFFLGARCCRSK